MEGCPRSLMLKLDLKESKVTSFAPGLKKYIREFYQEDDSSYAQECSQLEQLRTAVITPTYDNSGCNLLHRYYGQIHLLKFRFPMGEGSPASIEFTWTDLYTEDPITISDIEYEQSSILFNLGALHSLLGSNEDRVSEEGMKVACTHYQSAAGVFTYLKENFNTDQYSDTSKNLLNLYINVMLGQAQECLLEKSMLDNRKNSLVARIAMQVQNYYTEAIACLTSSFGEILPPMMHKHWSKTLQIKCGYLTALAYMYMGNTSEEQGKYGEKVAFMKIAVQKVKELQKLLKNQPQQMQEVVQFINDVVTQKLDSAKRDNDFVYHEAEPSATALPEIKGASLVKPIPFQPYDPSMGKDIFEKLIPMKAHESSSLYSEEKANLLRRYVSIVNEKDKELSSWLASMHIDDLLRPEETDTLPAELLTKCESLQSNPGSIKKAAEMLAKMKEKASELEEKMKETKKEITDVQKEKINFMEKYSVKFEEDKLSELLSEVDGYQKKHTDASKANEEIEKAFESHRHHLELMIGPEQALHGILPSQNILDSPIEDDAVQRIRDLLAKIEKMKTQRSQFMEKLREQINKDDITHLIATRDNTDLQSLFSEELKKHNESCELLQCNLDAQEKIMNALTEANAKYAHARRSVAEIKAKRDVVVKSLLNSYDFFTNFKEKVSNGVTFFDNLSQIFEKRRPEILAKCKAEKDRLGKILENAKKIKEERENKSPGSTIVPGTSLETNTPNNPQLSTVHPASYAMTYQPRPFLGQNVPPGKGYPVSSPGMQPSPRGLNLRQPTPVQSGLSNRLPSSDANLAPNQGPQISHHIPRISSASLLTTRPRMSYPYPPVSSTPVGPYRGPLPTSLPWQSSESGPSNLSVSNASNVVNFTPSLPYGVRPPHAQRSPSVHPCIPLSQQRFPGEPQLSMHAPPVNQGVSSGQRYQLDQSMTIRDPQQHLGPQQHFGQMEHMTQFRKQFISGSSGSLVQPPPPHRMVSPRSMMPPQPPAAALHPNALPPGQRQQLLPQRPTRPEPPSYQQQFAIVSGNQQQPKLYQQPRLISHQPEANQFSGSHGQQRFPQQSGGFQHSRAGLLQPQHQSQPPQLQARFQNPPPVRQPFDLNQASQYPRGFPPQPLMSHQVPHHQQPELLSRPPDQRQLLQQVTHTHLQPGSHLQHVTGSYRQPGPFQPDGGQQQAMARQVAYQQPQLQDHTRYRPEETFIEKPPVMQHQLGYKQQDQEKSHQQPMSPVSVHPQQIPSVPINQQQVPPVSIHQQQIPSQVPVQQRPIIRSSDPPYPQVSPQQFSSRNMSQHLDAQPNQQKQQVAQKHPSENLTQQQQREVPYKISPKQQEPYPLSRDALLPSQQQANSNTIFPPQTMNSGKNIPSSQLQHFPSSSNPPRNPESSYNSQINPQMGKQKEPGQPVTYINQQWQPQQVRRTSLQSYNFGRRSEKGDVENVTSQHGVNTSVLPQGSSLNPRTSTNYTLPASNDNTSQAQLRNHAKEENSLPSTQLPSQVATFSRSSISREDQAENLESNNVTFAPHKVASKSLQDFAPTKIVLSKPAPLSVGSLPVDPSAASPKQKPENNSDLCDTEEAVIVNRDVVSGVNDYPRSFESDHSSSDIAHSRKSQLNVKPKPSLDEKLFENLKLLDAQKPVKQPEEVAVSERFPSQIPHLSDTPPESNSPGSNVQNFDSSTANVPGLNKQALNNSQFKSSAFGESSGEEDVHKLQQKVLLQQQLLIEQQQRFLEQKTLGENSQVWKLMEQIRRQQKELEELRSEMKMKEQFGEIERHLENLERRQIAVEMERKEVSKQKFDEEETKNDSGETKELDILTQEVKSQSELVEKMSVDSKESRQANIEEKGNLSEVKDKLLVNQLAQFSSTPSSQSENVNCTSTKDLSELSFTKGDAVGEDDDSLTTTLGKSSSSVETKTGTNVLNVDPPSCSTPSLVSLENLNDKKVLVAEKDDVSRPPPRPIRERPPHSLPPAETSAVKQDTSHITRDVFSKIKSKDTGTIVDDGNLAKQETYNDDYFIKLVSAVEDYRERVNELSKRQARGPSILTQEWLAVQDYQDSVSDKMTCDVGKKNVTKNRYLDILPYDQTRVILVDKEDSDYINATMIENLTPLSPKYIASQGPIPQCFMDFWLMIWQQKCPLIVMLTKEVEGKKLKCHQYWPRDEGHSMLFGCLRVTMKRQTSLALWKERIIQISHSETHEVHVVEHYQYTGWPDHGVPSNPSDFFTFMAHIYVRHQTVDPDVKMPMLLHCSAGVGRTGAFIVVYSAMRELYSGNGFVDVMSLVKKLREKRKYMVQKKEQYEFCYKGILYCAEQFLILENGGNITTEECSDMSLSDDTISSSSNFMSDDEEPVKKCDDFGTSGPSNEGSVEGDKKEDKNSAAQANWEVKSPKEGDSVPGAYSDKCQANSLSSSEITSQGHEHTLAKIQCGDAHYDIENTMAGNPLSNFQEIEVKPLPCGDTLPLKHDNKESEIDVEKPQNVQEETSGEKVIDGELTSTKASKMGETKYKEITQEPAERVASSESEKMKSEKGSKENDAVIPGLQEIQDGLVKETYEDEHDKSIRNKGNVCGREQNSPEDFHTEADENRDEEAHEQIETCDAKSPSPKNTAVEPGDKKANILPKEAEEISVQKESSEKDKIKALGREVDHKSQENATPNDYLAETEDQMLQ